MEFTIPKTKKLKTVLHYNQELENPYQMSLEEYYRAKQKI